MPKEPKTDFRLALGVERLGLLSLAHPWLVGVAAIVLMILAAFGVLRLEVDDSLSQLFRSDTPEFRQFEEVTRRFPSSEFDVLVVVESKNLLARDNLEKLRDLVTDLQLVDGARGIISIFSARQPPEGDHLPAALFPEPLPEGHAYKKFLDRVTSNEIIRGKLLAENGELTLVVLALDPDATQGARMRRVVEDIRRTAKEDLSGSDLNAELSGVPIMQLEIRNAVERDRLLYNGIGFVAGCVIAILFFRHFSFMIMAAAPPLTAILLSLGALGWLDFRLNMFLNVMTPLIMVISFSDSMQLTFATRDRLLAGQSKVAALRNSLLIVGPACVLTHATAALSFCALQLSQSELIRTFGEAGLIATLIALAAILLLTPVIGFIVLRDAPEFVARIKVHDYGVAALRRFCAFIAGRMVNRPGLYSILALLVVGALSVNYARLEPRYRLADQAPDREQAVTASARLDAALAGANPLDVLIELPAGASLYAPETLKVIGAVHAILEQQPQIANVWSLETLRRWLAEKAHRSDVATLKQYVDILPEHLTRRFIDAHEDAIVVTGRVADVDASLLLPVIERLDQALGQVRAAHPTYRISVTGLSAIAARNSANMIGKLNRALTLEFLGVAMFIGLAFRSVVVMLSAVLPGIFPIVASGALLSLMGQGLQFSSIVALTVSFGLGLSATIHFLNRQRLEDDPGADPGVAIARATVLVGPALILTSVVLACGLAVTVFSDLPALRLFGWLSAFAMLAALAADLFILRPTAMLLRATARRFSRDASKR
ncbi:MAG TPA: MMPL family transporter [Methylocystis sp.]|nr:MMPL family transporter [Methylocystis sp.]